MTAAGALHVQLKVEQSDADGLPAPHGDRPVTAGAPEVLLRVVGTGDVAVIVEHRTVGWRTTTRHFQPCKRSLREY